MSDLYPFVRQATEEFPAALESVRAQLPVDDGPVGVLGGSLGGAVALRISRTPRYRSSPAPS